MTTLAVTTSIYIFIGLCALPVISIIYWRRFPEIENGPMSALTDVFSDQKMLLALTVFLWPVFVANAITASEG